MTDGVQGQGTGARQVFVLAQDGKVAAQQEVWGVLGPSLVPIMVGPGVESLQGCVELNSELVFGDFLQGVVGQYVYQFLNTVEARGYEIGAEAATGAFTQ
ncbi:hypothetical protein [Nocardia aurea]|uniref:hypothetical protein n=1 Tax=Nocardia aurea TaxID=2144174 RepID=UPI000D694EA9|nr:hypothetical protein [Nocardia aurea]